MFRLDQNLDWIHVLPSLEARYKTIRFLSESLCPDIQGGAIPRLKTPLAAAYIYGYLFAGDTRGAPLSNMTMLELLDGMGHRKNDECKMR